MKSPFSIFVLLFIFILSGCKDDFILKMEGITEINEMGEIYGSVDPSDWRLDDKWTKEEEGFFSVSKGVYNKSATYTYSPTDAVPISRNTFKVYPNPFTSSIIFYQPFNAAKYNVRVIDKSKRVILAYDNVGTSPLRIDIPVSTETQYYRVYYKIFDQSTVYRGHGDILQKQWAMY